MKKLRYKIEKGTTMGVLSAVYLSDDEEPSSDALVEDAYQSISTELMITVSGVTMFAAAWEDPAHWGTDWAEKLGIEHDAVDDAVAALLAQAVETDG